MRGLCTGTEQRYLPTSSGDLYLSLFPSEAFLHQSFAFYLQNVGDLRGSE